MNGFINLIKPKGMSSAYAVGAVKKKFKCPCGHMGTLDPMASGILPVGVGKASRLFRYLSDKEKTYVADFKFGVLTDTLDITGTVTETAAVIPSEERIIKELPRFVGEIEQIPPKYSAKCVNGKRGYALARKGVDFDLEARKVTVLGFSLREKLSESEFRFTVNCKGGTYIRSLARDLGYAAGSVAVMSGLLRERCGVFDMGNAVELDEFINSAEPEKYLIPADKTVAYPKIILDSERATKILNGVFERLGYADGLYRVYNECEFWGIGKSEKGILKIEAYVR